MQIVCISASNIKHAGNNSTSFKTSKLIKNIIDAKTSNKYSVEILSLVNYELTPCIGCGSCFKRDSCIHDHDFSKIYKELVKADALFIVSAHYAPIPSKLAMLLEKIEQLAFLKRFHDESYRSPLYQKPVGIIGHGGGTEEIITYYKSPVLDSIWNALSYPVEMNIIGIDEEQNHGVVIPVMNVKKEEHSFFPVQEYDWLDIENRITPLIEGVIANIRE